MCRHDSRGTKMLPYLSPSDSSTHTLVTSDQPRLCHTIHLPSNRAESSHNSKNKTRYSSWYAEFLAYRKIIARCDLAITMCSVEIQISH
ncbi:hypothetical protein JTE90_028132 [Oedothorax gibbosus]|uniref:Uncharacterized protein n=1 Tax=Oedothorax gibbosus TaxID=931172 RepID=A0AAV6V958_9ARAC|nr:hypothetical protein JTE90_028132 [Oedothorax gibbosus]